MAAATQTATAAADDDDGTVIFVDKNPRISFSFYKL
jgi:hypothetical protein